MQRTLFGRILRHSLGAAVLLSLATCLTAQPSPNPSEVAHRVKKSVHAAKQPEAPIPQTPIPAAPLTLEQLPAQPPLVSYQAGQLTIDSQNSMFTDVLKTACGQIGAQLDLPASAADERVAVHLTGTARETLSALLDGSNLDYIIVGSPDNPEHIERLILTLRREGSGKGPTLATASPPATPQPVVAALPPPTFQDSEIPAAPVQAAAQLPTPSPPSRPGSTNLAPGNQLDCADMGLPPNCQMQR